MDKDPQKSITITIGGRDYPLKVTASNEPMVRQVVKEVNQKITHFQATYGIKERIDAISMALFTYALETKKLESKSPTNDNDKLDQLITRLESVVDNF